MPRVVSFRSVTLLRLVPPDSDGSDQPDADRHPWVVAVVRWLEHPWTPLVIGVICGLAVFVLWRALVHRERNLVELQVAAAAQHAQETLARQFHVAEQAMHRLADWTATDPAIDTWSRQAASLVRDVEGLQQVIWLQADGKVRVAVPGRTMEPALEQLLQRSLPPPAPPASVRYISSDDRRNLVALLSSCGGRNCSGPVAGVLSIRELARPLYSDSLRGFHAAVWVENHVLARSAEPAAVAVPYLRRVRADVGGLLVTLAIWPTSTTLARTRSLLPNLVLLFGLLLSALLPALLRSVQVAASFAARQERARLNVALERSTDGIWDWDVPSGVVVRSASIWRHLGYGASQGAKNAAEWTNLIHPDDQARVARILGDHVAGQRDAYEAEYRLRSSAGSWHIILDRGRAVLRGLDGQATRVLGITADITEQRRSSETLLELERLSTMGRLAARVAHEINNPLAGIHNAFQLIKGAVPASHPHVKYVGAIEREIARIAAITRQLYETYRPESEVVREASVHTVLSDAVSMLEQANRARRVRLEVEMRPPTGVIAIPDAVLRQCVYNLIQNAIEAAPDDSVVHIAGTIEQDVFVLRVRDAGAGIPEELRERVFEPFFSTKPHTLKTGGMGLGLALVNRSVRALGGAIQILVPSSGGTEVVVRLPLSPTSQAQSLS